MSATLSEPGGSIQRSSSEGGHRFEAGRLVELGLWVTQTCVLFGATPATAFLVAAAFVEALEMDV
jgi:hypothetical protein